MALEAGLHYGMTDETYHADPIEGGSLSSTMARLLTNHVPAKAEAIWRNRKSTKSMEMGKAAHALALGTGPELIVWEHDGRTKAGKEERAAAAALIAAETAVAVSESERDQITAMAAALRAHPQVAKILDNSKHEVSGFWREGDTWCRARFDILTPTAGWDYKTTDDVSPAGFEHAMATYGYHQQAEFYTRMLRSIGHPGGHQPMRFICQEKQEPYLVQIHTCDDLAMEVAAALNDRAIDIYAEAKRDGIWSAYPSLDAEPTGLPARYFYRHAEAIPAHLNPYVAMEINA